MTDAVALAIIALASVIAEALTLLFLARLNRKLSPDELAAQLKDVFDRRGE